MFERSQFIADCEAATREGPGHSPVREVVARAVSDPGAVLGGLGEPRRAGIEAIHRAPDLTILNVVWGAQMTLMPHDHRVWAVIGIYTGREDNIFWRRLPSEEGGRIEAAGARALSVKDAVLLGRDIIHSVTNPIRRLTGAIHVYGGDFFDIERSEWDPETLSEQRYDMARALKAFADAGASQVGAGRGRRPSPRSE
jgi:predicted metal-dependent enzyme (double-stranded beta helix superfamily)